MIDNDSSHQSATLAVTRNRVYECLIPAPVLPELSHLLAKRMGHHVLRAFIKNLVVGNPEITDLKPEDYKRIASVLEEYSDLRLDFTDAAIFAIAERMQIQHILTLDRRDFQVFRPLHCQYFQLLP